MATANAVDTTKNEALVTPQPSETTATISAEMPKDDVHLLGWSKDGKILAYRVFALSEAIARHSYLNVVVVNLVDDKVVWSFSKNWQEDNVGGDESEAESSPTSGEEAWERVASVVTPVIDSFNLDDPSELSIDDSYDVFPLETEDGSFDIDVQSTEQDVHVAVVKDNTSRKKIYEEKLEPGMMVEASVSGYFVNPQRNRIAVIVREFSFSMNNNFYSITGCLLTSGF